jgi:beta-lactamase superfamily II metal-dependent hydrolase
MKRFTVDKLVLNISGEYTAEDYSALINIARSKGVEIIKTISGDQYLLSGNATIKILYPPRDYKYDPTDLNDGSVVSRLSYGDIDFLFTGDAGVAVEAALIRSDYDLSSEVLKVGHHGSKYSSSERFIEAVRPEYAVIQSGVDNSFGHPHSETLKVLNNNNVEALRNDLLGDVICETDGLSIKCF